MASNAGASRFAQIHSQIHALGFVCVVINRLELLRQFHHFLKSRGLAQMKLSHMRVGHDHDVAGGIREAVQDDEAFLPAVNDQRLLIAIARKSIAEDAVWLLALGSLLQVLVAPRRPEVVHLCSVLKRTHRYR